MARNLYTLDNYLIGAGLALLLGAESREEPRRHGGEHEIGGQRRPAARQLLDVGPATEGRGRSTVLNSD